MSSPRPERRSSLQEIEAVAGRPETRGRAIDMAIAALGDGREDALVLALVGEGLEADGHLEDAAALAHRATVLHPDHAEIWTRFSRSLAKLGRRTESAEAAASAVRLDAASYPARMAAAEAFLNLNAFAVAAEHAQAAAALRPTAAEPPSTLAIIHARLSRYSEARAFAERALRVGRTMPGAEIALARVELAEDRVDLAIARLRRILAAETLHPGHRAEALSLLGDALDLSGDAAKAFATYAASNALVARRSSAGRPQGARRAVEHAAALEAYFRTADPAPWRRAAGGNGAAGTTAGHAFLIGFPRSGTTLLENALALHPGVSALEETDALALCAGDLLADGASLDRLAGLSAEAADEHRAIYWRRAGELLGQPLAGRFVLDKLPIGTVALPVIVKLFPAAKLLFARRDPRDVVLSCFRRLFGDNEVMTEFLSLESAARYFDQVMRLARLYEERLPLALHVVRHEDVIADFDARLAEILAFLGLDWDPAVRDFATRAVYARTPSATQLAAGLNAKGVGAWRRYEREMRPVAPLLEPWAERFGYRAADHPVSAPADDPGASVRADIARALAAGDWRTAFARADEAFARGSRDEILHRLRAVRAQREARLPDAIADFHEALKGSPGDVSLLAALGLCLARLGRSVEALASLDEAIALGPDYPPAHFSRGFALEALGDPAAAAAAYARAARLDPNHAEALGALANLASRRADWAEARQFAGRALAIAPALASASLALAAAEAAQGEGEKAEERLLKLLEAEAGAHERAVAQGALGDVLHMRDRPHEAFRAYEASAAALRVLHTPRFAASGLEPASRRTERLTTWFDAADPAAWRPPIAPARDTPAFLLGFPRSGTTLLGKALGLHPALFTLDERDTFGDSVAAFYGDPAGLRRLEILSAGEAMEFRDRYLARARAFGWPEDDTRLIDKLPTHTLALPIIAKVLPGAKIVILRRDPRDVVLSCFRRRFVINSTTVEFLSLEGAARLYDGTMRLFEMFRSRLSLDIRIQGYERLVADFEGEMSAILAFLDLQWEPRVADFAGRGPLGATPSSAQLARGLTDEGIGAWRAYEFALQPVLPILAPWVERFGYSLD